MKSDIEEGEPVAQRRKSMSWRKTPPLQELPPLRDVSALKELDGASYEVLRLDPSPNSRSDKASLIVRDVFFFLLALLPFNFYLAMLLILIIRMSDIYADGVVVPGTSRIVILVPHNLKIK